MKTFRQSLNEMFEENKALSLIRVMTFMMFIVIIITIFRVFGRHHDMSEPILTALLTFEFAVFSLLCSLCFAGKTKLNIKNFKDGFDLEKDNTPTNSPSESSVSANSK